jgi:Ca-activated chloride channel family protein
LFDLELAWNRSAHTGSYVGEHVLRVRVKPGTATGGTLPVRMAIAVDTSGSMAGEKLDAAREACASVVGHLRPQDKVWIAAFSTRLAPLLEGISGDANARSAAQNALSTITAEGVTRTDGALNWIHQVLQPESGAVRVGVLITDGHATDPRGNALTDLKPLVARAGQIGDAGIAIFTMGLGSADDFNTAFLDDLSKGGGGAFLYANALPELEHQLASRLISSQAMAVEDARFSFHPLMGDVRVVGLCRIRPDFVPMDIANTVRAGNLRADKATDFLITLSIPPKQLSAHPGQYPVMAVTLDAQGVSVTRQASIEYTASFARAQLVDPEVDRDRLNWDINSFADALNRTTDPNETGQLLSNLEAAARKAGQDDLAQKASQQKQELEASGKLSAHRRSQVLTQARNAGGDS